MCIYERYHWWWFQESSSFSRKSWSPFPELKVGYVVSVGPTQHRGFSYSYCCVNIFTMRKLLIMGCCVTVFHTTLLRLVTLSHFQDSEESRRDRKTGRQRSRSRSRSRSRNRDHRHSKSRVKHGKEGRDKGHSHKDRSRSRSPKKSKDKERSRYRWGYRTVE